MTEAVAKRSAAVEKMVSDAARIRALMGGTTAMRAAGKTYLPKFEAETEDAYADRLKLSWLFNGTRKTVRDMTGRVFAKPVEVEQGSTQITDWCMNVDLQGRDLSTFARDVFEDGLAGPGISYIMVDAPPRLAPVTKTDAQAQGLRPYFVHLQAEEILGWKTAVVANVTVLAQLRIMESVTVPDQKDEFAEVSIPQVRVLDRMPGGVQTRLFRKVQDKELWAQEGEPTISAMTEITVVPFYANRTGFFTGESLLDDLADVNIAHWQSQSDQRNILQAARVPILFAAGRSLEDGAITIGAKSAVIASDPAASLSWVEHSGQAIGAGRQDLKDLEFQMEAHGLQLLVASAQSATGAALDAAKETSQLAMTADALKDALEQALAWMAAYGGLTEDVTVTVNKDFGAGMMTAQEMGVLLNAVNSGNMSRETFLKECRRRGMVRADLDVEAEAERIDNAAPVLTGQQLPLGGE